MLREMLQFHSARAADGVIFGEHLGELEERRDGYHLHLQLTGTAGRIAPADLDRLCPDWRVRQTFASGPRELLDALVDHWAAEGDPGLLAIEAESDGATPILVAGEEAGADLPFGCRMGICRTCLGRLCSGEVRDLRTGEVYGTEGEMVRTCVNAPEGPVEIAL